ERSGRVSQWILNRRGSELLNHRFISVAAEAVNVAFTHTEVPGDFSDIISGCQHRLHSIDRRTGMAVPDRMNAREDPRRKVLRLDEIGRPHGDGVLNGILEFTDIAWPVVSTKHRFCFAGDTQHGSARPASELRNESPRQQG